MPKVHRITNPYCPQDNIETSEALAGASLADVGESYADQPWLCIAYIDGERYFPKREEWADIKLEDGDCVYFLPYVGTGAELFIFAIIVGVAAVAIALSLAPGQGDDQADPESVFTLKGQKNQNRLGGVIEDSYGRSRLWPSYGTRIYQQYYGNEQFQYSLLCLGHGSYDIEEIYIDDTPIDQFQEVEYEVYAPGESVTLFPDNVVSSVEVGSIELFGTGQIESGYDGITGPFTANPVGTLTNRLEVDFELPRGLYFYDNDGDFRSLTISWRFEYREIDDLGDPVGVWEILNENLAFTLRNINPQRYTFLKDVPEGRYEVRATRLDNGWNSTKITHTTIWAGLRAFLPSTQDYGDVTMLAVKARATNSLNDSSSNKINLYATRKLPNYDSGTNTLAAVDDYANRTATRSPIWAMVNVLRAKYGGNIGDTYLDLQFFADEAVIADASSTFFDWTYDRKTTVWEALKLACFVNKSIPMLNGSKISFIRDQPATLPSFFINPENTKSGSFKLTRKLFDLQENDGLRVEYTDSVTWKKETVLCLLPGETGNNPKRLSVKGITDRQRAYDLGMYAWFKQSNEREEVSVTTGQEGYLPTYGDLGRFGSDIPRWGQNGFVEGVSGQTITLSEEVTFTDGQVHQLAIRGKLGQDLGPYTVTAGSNSKEVIVVGLLPVNEFYFDYQNEPPYFIFGTSNIVGKVCRIVNLRPSGDNVAIKAVVDNQGRHADFGTAPTLEEPDLPPEIPAFPVVSSLTVSPIANSTTLATVSWSPAFGASSYVLEESIDGIEWVPVAEVQRTSYALPITTETTLYLRVAAVNTGIGPWATWTGPVGQVTSAPDDVLGLAVQPEFTGLSANFSWHPTGQATSYEVKVYTQNTLRCTHEVTATKFEYTLDAAESCGGKFRVVGIEVRAKNSIGLSENAATLTVSNTPPAALTGAFSNTLINDKDTVKVVRLEWPVTNVSDFSNYRVWGSSTQGFTPGSGNILTDTLANSYEVLISGGPQYTDYYWRVAAVDVWGDETLPSIEFTVNA